MIYLVSTMQKSWSLWVLAMVNDLVVKSGGHYFGDVRTQFRLGWFVRQSGHMPNLRPQTALHLLLTQAAGCKFALHTHSEPNLSIRALIKLRTMRPVYIYRDPRDVARSMFEYGQKIKDQQIRSDTTFDQLESMEEAIHLTASFIDVWRQWAQVPGMVTTTYEGLRLHPVEELVRLCDHLGLSVTQEHIEKVVERYRPSGSPELDTHTSKAVAGLWKDVLTPDQVDLCHRLFGPAIEEMGYEL
jgi:hypothetical protein